MFTYALLAIIALAVFSLLVRWYEIAEHEQGVLFRKGRVRDVQGAGFYFRFRPTTRVEKVDLRKRVRNLSGQELLTADGIGLKVSLAFEYSVIDARTSVVDVQDLDASIHVLTQLAVRDVLTKRDFEKVMTERAGLGAELLTAVEPHCGELGIVAHRLEIKDLMLPGELKKIFSQVAQARHEGAAALERARGETAALRSLANAAKMLEVNPHLHQVRLFDIMANATGNTFVIGTEALSSPKQ